jgi:methionyl-tRNA formyltransferase
VNIVFLGDAANEFSNRHFRALEDACSGAACSAEQRGAAAGSRRIVAVVDSPREGWVSTRQGGTDRSPPFDLRAEELGVPVLQPGNPNGEATVAQLARTKPHLLVAVGYTRRLGAALLGLPPLGAVNFHASLLPAYRGKHPVFWALFHGERSAGLTVHLMEPRIDEGPILLQVRVRTRVTDSVAALYERIMDRSIVLVARLLADAEARSARGGRLRGRRQDERGSSYFSSTSEADFRLTWSMPADLIVRRASCLPGRFWFELVRAELVRAGLARAELSGGGLQGGRIFVKEAAVAPAFAGAGSGGPAPAGAAPGATAGASRGASAGVHAPGVLLALGKRHAVVAAAGGAVRLVRLAEGDGTGLPGEFLAAAGLLRARGLRPGDSLGPGLQS